MARLDGLTDADASVVTRAVFRAARKKIGAVPDPLRIMALNPAIMWAAGGFEIGLGQAKRVDARLKTLASLKVASRVGCLF